MNFNIYSMSFSSLIRKCFLIKHIIDRKCPTPGTVNRKIDHHCKTYKSSITFQAKL